MGVKFTAFGRPRRVTWYRAEGDVSATEGVLLGTGGIDLDPEPGSPAALREDRIRRHPRLHAALAVAGGVGKVLGPLLLGLLAVRLTISVPWPDWNLPSIPWPHLDLPSIPWPDVDLPDWKLLDWVTWLANKVIYVWPVILAWVLARTEIRRRREQDMLLRHVLKGDVMITATSMSGWHLAAGVGLLALAFFALLALVALLAFAAGGQAKTLESEAFSAAQRASNTPGVRHPRCSEETRRARRAPGY